MEHMYFEAESFGKISTFKEQSESRIYLKAHSAEPATVPWGHSGTASENMSIVPVMIYEQFKLSSMVHSFILRVYVFAMHQTYA